MGMVLGTRVVDEMYRELEHVVEGDEGALMQEAVFSNLRNGLPSRR